MNYSYETNTHRYKKHTNVMFLHSEHSYQQLFQFVIVLKYQLWMHCTQLKWSWGGVTVRPFHVCTQITRFMWPTWVRLGPAGPRWTHVGRMDLATKVVTLTHCGLVTPYGDIDRGEHWLKVIAPCNYGRFSCSYVKSKLHNKLHFLFKVCFNFLFLNKKRIWVISAEFLSSHLQNRIMSIWKYKT